MLRIAVIDTHGGVQDEIACAAGERLIDAFDEARGPVVFGCRSATCGVCLIEVLEGSHMLAAPDPIEQVALEDLAAAPTDRLACRASAGSHAGLVRVRARAPR